LYTSSPENVRMGAENKVSPGVDGGMTEVKAIHGITYLRCSPSGTKSQPRQPGF
jgi:hypothetical protein